MFGQKRADVEAQKTYSARKDPKSIFFERPIDRFSNKFHTFLKVLFLAWNVAYLDHDDITTAIERIPQKVNAMMTADEARKTAEEMMSLYQEKMDKGEPLPIDLISFYLEQEHLTAGVSDETIAKAREHFDALMEAAQRQQANGWSREQTIGWVLKQQGEYDDSQGLLADLLAAAPGKAKSKCSSRLPFITSAMQVLFPKEVAEGRLKIETFPDHIDENGVFQHGHVRAVFDEGDHIDVLEGDVIHRDDDVAKHRKIGMYEATTMAVKSLAVSQGLDTFDKEEAPNKALIAKQRHQDVKRASYQSPSSILENLSKGLHDTLVSNAVGAYPTGTQLYGDGRDHMNINPKPVHGNYALSHEDYDKGVIGEIRFGKTPETRKPLTMENFNDALFQEEIAPGGAFKVLTDFSKFSTLDPDAVQKVMKVRKGALSNEPFMNFSSKESTITLRGDQSLPPDAIEKGTDPISWIFHGNPLLRNFHTPTNSITVDGGDYLPEDLNRVKWTGDALLNITLNQQEEIVFANSGGIAEAVHNGLKNITLITEGTKMYEFAGANFEGLTFNSLKLGNIRLFGSFLNGSTLDSFVWLTDGSSLDFALAGASIKNTTIIFRDSLFRDFPRDEKPYIFNNAIFNSELYPSFSGKNISIRCEDLEKSVLVSPETFKGMTLDSLTIGNGVVLSENALNGAYINTLVINGRRGDALTKTVEGALAFVHGNILRIIVIQDGDAPLDGGLSLWAGVEDNKRNDAMVEVDKKELSKFRKKSKIPYPIFIVIDETWARLKETYHEEKAIPETVLLKDSFLIDYFHFKIDDNAK